MLAIDGLQYFFVILSRKALDFLHGFRHFGLRGMRINRSQRKRRRDSYTQSHPRVLWDTKKNKAHLRCLIEKRSYHQVRSDGPAASCLFTISCPFAPLPSGRETAEREHLLVRVSLYCRSSSVITLALISLISFPRPPHSVGRVGKDAVASHQEDPAAIRSRI